MKFQAVLGVSLFVLTAALAPAAHADIYKCKDEHGNVAYLQLPCPAEKEEEAPVTDDEATSTVEEVPDEAIMESSPEPDSVEVHIPSSRRPGEPLDDCKKRYRDQIDEIDAEMRTAFSPEQGKAYKERLLALTRQLRACK